MPVLVGIAILIALLGLPWLVVGNDFFLYRYFAPKHETARRQVFEESKSYRQGLIQEIQNMQFQYEQASPSHRAALRSVILHRVADVPDDALTPDVRAFLVRLRRER